MPKQIRSKTTNGSINKDTPIKITIELDLVIRVRQDFDSPINTSLLLTEDVLGGSECPEDKFTYSFETDNAKVLYIKVENYTKPDPGNYGDFTTCIPDANRFIVIAIAQVLNPGGRASLTMKYLGKDVFSSPKELELGENGFLMINTTTKLPI